MKVGLKDYSNF